MPQKGFLLPLKLRKTRAKFREKRPESPPPPPPRISVAEVARPFAKWRSSSGRYRKLRNSFARSQELSEIGPYDIVGENFVKFGENGSAHSCDKVLPVVAPYPFFTTFKRIYLYFWSVMLALIYLLRLNGVLPSSYDRIDRPITRPSGSALCSTFRAVGRKGNDVAECIVGIETSHR